MKRIIASGRVAVSVVLTERTPAVSRVEGTGCVLKSASNPAAVLLVPVVRLKRALVPSAVLPPGYPPSGGGGGRSACVIGASPKQAKTTRVAGVVFLSWINGFRVLPSFSPLGWFCCGSGRGRREQSLSRALKKSLLRFALLPRGDDSFEIPLHCCFGHQRDSSR